jgi:hypothetical protein
MDDHTRRTSSRNPFARRGSNHDVTLETPHSKEGRYWWWWYWWSETIHGRTDFDRIDVSIGDACVLCLCLSGIYDDSYDNKVTTIPTTTNNTNKQCHFATIPCQQTTSIRSAKKK